jgi:rhodanese-related sulfurtransferase
MKVMNRRSFHRFTASALASYALALAADEKADPWSKLELMEPAQLAAKLNTSGARPNIICVAFPVLYRQRHIIHAEFAGPTSKPEGLDSLRSSTANLAKNAEIVIYCGCCPMAPCPNIRPAYRTLKAAGFTNVRVLRLETNFHEDWVAKGYPAEEQLGVPVK